MWVCIAMLLTTKPPVSAALAQAVCVRWAHMSQPMYKLHFIYLCDCKLAAIDEEEQKWECVKEEMQREKKKEEVFWQVMLLRGEERVTERDSGGGDWYRSALARSPDRRRLRQQQNWTHWTLCGPDWSQWLPALTPLHSETHTHSSIHRQPLIRVIMRNIVPTSSFRGVVCLYWGNHRNARQKSFACFYEFCGNTTGD